MGHLSGKTTYKSKCSSVNLPNFEDFFYAYTLEITVLNVFDTNHYHKLPLVMIIENAFINHAAVVLERL